MNFIVKLIFAHKNLNKPHLFINLSKTSLAYREQTSFIKRKFPESLPRALFRHPSNFEQEIPFKTILNTLYDSFLHRKCSTSAIQGDFLSKYFPFLFILWDEWKIKEISFYKSILSLRLAIFHSSTLTRVKFINFRVKILESG